MKIIAVIRSADHQSRNFDSAHVRMNAYDEAALAAALFLKKNDDTLQLIAVAAGLEQKPLLRQALALGADEAFILAQKEPDQSLLMAKLIAEFVRYQSAQMLLLGEQTELSGCRQTAAMSAALLGWPQFISASAMMKANEASGSAAEHQTSSSSQAQSSEIWLQCLSQEGAEWHTLAPNHVISANLSLAKLGIPNFDSVLIARKKTIQSWQSAEHKAVRTSGLKVLSSEALSTKRSVRYLNSTDELLACIKHRVNKS